LGSRSGLASRGLLSSRGDGIDPTEKKAQNKATVEMRNVLIDRRNSMANNDLGARRNTRGAKPKPVSVVTSRSIRLDDRPVAMSGAGEEHRRHQSGAVGRVARSKPIRRPCMKGDQRRDAHGSGVSREE
jgi:hypothetical protein